MGKVILDISMSLDGFIAGPNDNHENPLGDGGELAHEWVWNNRSVLRDKDMMQGGTEETTGAMVVGRRTYDLINGWGGNHPSVPNAPVFVVSHDIPKSTPHGTTPFIFVTEGIKEAVAQAKKAAGKKNVYVVGGANIAQQCIEEGLLDEMRLHVAHLLLGGGRKLFGDLSLPIKLKETSVINGPGVTHYRFSLPKKYEL